MKKSIVTILVISVFMISAPFLVGKASAADMSIRDFINLLVAIGVIPTEKMPAVNAYLATLDDNHSPVASDQASESQHTPTCSISTDKAVYTFGDTITYSWKSKNATYASWQQDISGKDYLKLPGDKLTTSGSQHVTANVIGNPTVTLLVNNGGKDGSCSKTVEVIYSPYCTLTSDKNSYSYGDDIVLSWTSQNATYASWYQDVSGKDYIKLPGDKLAVSGSQHVTANVIGNPTVTLLVNNGGKDGSCSKTFNVTTDTNN